MTVFWFHYKLTYRYDTRTTQKNPKKWVTELTLGCSQKLQVKTRTATQLLLFPFHPFSRASSNVLLGPKFDQVDSQNSLGILIFTVM